MHRQMPAELVRSCESLGAVGPGAHVRLLPGVGTHVGFEVIRSGELPVAHFAGEGSHTGVLAAVASELVRAGESLSAALVIADVGLLAGVFPNVHLQVGQLQVPLGAAGVETDKRLALLLGFGVLLLTNQVARLLSADLRHDEGGVTGHGHLDWRGTLVHMSISRDR